MQRIWHHRNQQSGQGEPAIQPLLQHQKHNAIPAIAHAEAANAHAADPASAPIREQPVRQILIHKAGLWPNVPQTSLNSLV